MPPPSPPEAVFSRTVVKFRLSGPPLLWMPPPPKGPAAVLPLIVLPFSVAVPASL